MEQPEEQELKREDPAEHERKPRPREREEVVHVDGRERVERHRQREWPEPRYRGGVFLTEDPGDDRVGQHPEDRGRNRAERRDNGKTGEQVAALACTVA